MLSAVGRRSIKKFPPCRSSSVILVEMANKVGALERISEIIADAGINIYYFYSTTSSGKTATCVIKTADDKKTIKVLHAA